MLGQSEKVLAELAADIPEGAFAAARERGASSDLSALLQQVESDGR
jgi:hypothetical protein